MIDAKILWLAGMNGLWPVRSISLVFERVSAAAAAADAEMRQQHAMHGGLSAAAASPLFENALSRLSVFDDD